MQLGMIGLGRMGAGMVRRLMSGGHECVVFDLNADNIKSLSNDGATGTTSLDDFVRTLEKPRAAWLMVPAGAATEQTVTQLAGKMDAGDIIIDGGNSYFKDDIRRAATVAQKGIHYVDVGTSGGVWGLERGYCIMAGGDADVFRHLEPLFKTLAPGPGDIPATRGRETRANSAEEGYLHCGPAGAGHFVKMIHNELNTV